MTFLKLLIPLLAVLALSPAPSADALGEEGTAACLPLRDIKTVGTPFRAGEKLTYMLNFKVGPVNTDVASVTLSIAEDEIDGRKALSSRLLGQTSRFYNTFFKLIIILYSGPLPYFNNFALFKLEIQKLTHLK